MTVTALTTQQADANEIMESVIVKGDLGRLTPQERTSYYMQVCRSTGLNPLTRPIEYLTLQGKTVLYARKDATDQLRKINGISIVVVSRIVEDGVMIVHVRATDNAGRQDEDFGAVNVAGLKADALANASMKAVTKAKRRVTLSISGLGFLDETEVETIPGAQRVPERRPPPQPAPSLLIAADQHDPETGEITDVDPPEVDAYVWLDAGKKAASFGMKNLQEWWKGLEKEQRAAIGTEALAGWKVEAARVDAGPADEDDI